MRTLTFAALIACPCASSACGSPWYPYEMSQLNGVLIEAGPGEILLLADVEHDGLDVYRLSDAGRLEPLAITGARPSSRLAYMAAFDEKGKRLVVFGGLRAEEKRCLAETWVLQDGSWRLLPGEGPPERDTGRLWYDRASQRVRLQGGSDRTCGGSIHHDEWALDADTWVPIQNLEPPGPMPLTDDMGFAADRDDNRLYLYGGIEDMDTRGDLWAYQNGTYGQLPQANFDVQTRLTALALDEHNKRLYRYGGLSEKGRRPICIWSGLLALDGDTWTHLDDDDAEEKPGSLYGATLAFDHTHQRILLFGGVYWSDPDGNYRQHRALWSFTSKSGWSMLDSLEDE